MPVTFDNVGRSHTSGANLSLVFTAAANAAMLIFTVGGSISAMAYAGVACTNYTFNAGAGTVQVWVLSAPASGVNTLSVNGVTGVTNLNAIVTTYTQVKDTNGFGTAQNTLTTGTVCNLSLSSSTTDLVYLAAWINDNGTANAHYNGAATLRASATVSTVTMLVYDITGAATTSVSASTATSTGFILLGVPLVFSAAAATGPFNLAMLGAGS